MTWPLIIFTLPTLIFGHVIGLLALMLGMAKKPHYTHGVLTLTWRDWVSERWHYSTTLGSCMLMSPYAGEKTLYHELIHVRQYEDLNLLAAIIGGLCCIFSWKFGLILWATSGALWLVPNFISGWIRHGDPYMGSEHERSAYAQTDVAYR